VHSCQAEARRNIFASRANTDVADGKGKLSALGGAVVKLPEPAEKSVTMRRMNMLYVTLDIEELDSTGRYNPVMLKVCAHMSSSVMLACYPVCSTNLSHEWIVLQDTPNEDPACVFRVSGGQDRPKRFIISVIQVDSADFLLER